MLGKGLQLKTTTLLVFFQLLLKSLKSCKNRIVGHLKKCGLFSEFEYGFRSTADLLAVVFDRIARATQGLGVLELYHLVYPRLLTGFGMLVFFTNLSLMEFDVRYLAIFLLFWLVGALKWFLKKPFKTLWPPFYGWCLTISTRLEPLQGSSLLFTTKFLKIPGTHFTSLRRIKGWFGLQAAQWFWTWDPWIGKPTS